MRSVNSNLMLPPSDDAYGHNAIFLSPPPRMRQNFHASSGRLAFPLNLAREAAVFDPVNARADLSKFGRQPPMIQDDVVPG